jgi:hypothetical protein
MDDYFTSMGPSEDAVEREAIHALENLRNRLPFSAAFNPPHKIQAVIYERDWLLENCIPPTKRTNVYTTTSKTTRASPSTGLQIVTFLAEK